MGCVNAWKGLLKSNAGLSTVLLLGIIVIMAAVAAGIATGWWESSGRYVGGWAWWCVFGLLMLGVIAVAVAGSRAAREFLSRYREQRFLKAARAEEPKVPEEGGDGEQRKLREKMQEAIRTLQQSPDLRRKGGLPLYAVPWYLLIGATQSGKTTLLRSVAQSFAPFGRPASNADGPTQNCDWWFFNTAIVLDTAGSYAFPAKGERDSTQWFRFLQLLRYYRELLPINGLIMTVGADTLAVKRSEDLRFEAAELRKRIDEAIRELGVDFPIYLLITRCDLIEGFTEFFGCLPPHVQKQVFGHISETRPLAADQQSQTTAAERLVSVHEEIVERLKQLRLSIFNEEKVLAPILRQKVFCFPEEFRALQQPLGLFAEALVGENPFQHKPFFRGLFFSSARQQSPAHSFLRQQLHFEHPARPQEAGTRPYFLHDLLAVILQRDQYLTRPVGRRRLFKQLSISAAGVALCLLLLLFLTWTFFSDRQILASVDQRPCTAAGGQSPTPLLAQAESCRQVVQRLIDLNRQRFAWSKFVFNSSGRLEGELRQLYVQKFQSEVLIPLDAGISQQLIAGSDTIALVVSLIKRIELINNCLSVFGCPQPIQEDMQPDYRLMLSAASQQAPATEQVAALHNAYEAYLHWAARSAEVLPREQAAHAERLRQWFSAKQFAPRQILFWASQNYPPVTAQQFWEGLPATDAHTITRVDGAYTPAAWKQSISPFLERAGDAVPGMAPLLKNFQEQYRAQYFDQWGRFLLDFPRGEASSWKTREQRRRLAVALLDEHSPYHRVIDVVLEQLRPFLPMDLLPTDVAQGQPVQEAARFPWNLWPGQAISQRWRRLWGQKEPSMEETGATDAPTAATPAWVHLLRHYAKSESRKAYGDALKQLRQQLAGEASMEKSFQLAQAGFQEGRPTEKSTHPVLKAWWIIDQFREREGSGPVAAQKPFWPLLERPVLIVWRVILDGAGEFLQKSWAENVLAPARGFSEMEQLEFFYGPQGKVREFVSQFAKPFLADNESRLGQMLGEELPLGAGFLKALRDEKQLKPLLELGKRSPHRVGVEATRESIIDSQTNVVEEKTEFLLECDARQYRLSNRPKDPTEAATAVFWSAEGCGEALITILMTCDKRCVERAASVGISVSEAPSLRVTKRYKGQSGFLRFIQEFSGGSRSFGLGDFADAQAPAEGPRSSEALRRYRINSIRVFYRVDVPPSLSKLMSLAPSSAPPAAIVK